MQQELEFDLEVAHTHFAKSTNGRTWALLAKNNRTIEDDFEMIRTASASLYHWSQIGTALQLQRGEWLMAHVYTVLEFREGALRHAARCLELTQANPELMEDFDLAYGFEGIARALALNGKTDEAQSFYDLAKADGAKIMDDEDRSIFLSDFEGGNWFGLA
jgi:hypothetical protein